MAVLNAAVAVFALLACFFAIFIVILYKKWKFFSQRLIFYLIIAALLANISTIIHGIEYNIGFCAFTGFTGQVTAWMSFNSITAVTIYIFLLAVFNKYTEKYELLYCIYIFFVPLTFSWIPFINNSYGEAGVWCWIRNLNRDCTPFIFGRTLQLVLFYIPIFTILFVLFALYLIIICKLQRNLKQWRGTYDHEKETTNRKQRLETLYLMIYPMIYFILYLPLVINRIYSWISDEPLIVFWYLSAIAYPLQGGIVVLAFTLDSHTRRRLNWAHIKAAFRRRRKKKSVVTDYALGEGVVEKEWHRDEKFEAEYMEEIEEK